MTTTADWPINADEPGVLDYNTDFKSAGQIGSLYAPDEFRIADHNPVLVDLSLTPTVDLTALVRAGGHLVLANSAGLKAGDFGSQTGFVVHARTVRFAMKPWGGASILWRRTEPDGLHTYLLIATSVTTLITNGVSGQGTLLAQGRTWDVTRPHLPRLIDLRSSVRITMDDNGEPGVLADTIGITVWNKQGALFFSTNWNGTTTSEQPIAGGNVRVR